MSWAKAPRDNSTIKRNIDFFIIVILTKQNTDLFDLIRLDLLFYLRISDLPAGRWVLRPDMAIFSFCSYSYATKK